MSSPQTALLPTRTTALEIPARQSSKASPGRVV
jgi:hypothetical protein